MLSSRYLFVTYVGLKLLRLFKISVCCVSILLACYCSYLYLIREILSFVSKFRPCGLLRFRNSFWNQESFKHLGRTPWRGNRPIAWPLTTQDSITQRRNRLYVHALNGVRTHDPSVQAVQDHTRLRRRGHWDRPW